MPNLDYSYPTSGGYRLQTDGAAGGVGSLDPSGMMDFYKEMAARRLAEHEQDRARKIAAEDAAAKRQATVYAQAQSPVTGRNQAADRMQEARDRDELMQMSARQHNAPQKLITGPQIIPGFVDDKDQMNAYQRQTYLPGSSSMTGGPTGQESAAADEMGNEAELEKARQILNLKSRAGGGIAGRDTADWYSLGSHGR